MREGTCSRKAEMNMRRLSGFFGLLSRFACLALLFSVLVAGPAEHRQKPHRQDAQPHAQPSAASLSTFPSPPALETREKFRLALDRSLLSPLRYGTTALSAGFSMAIDSEGDRGLGMGFDGFLLRWGDRFGSRTVREFAGTFLAAGLLHQDPRYQRAPHRTFWKRTGYALSRVVVGRSDEGKAQFNASNLIGITAGAAASTGWHPPEDRGVRLFFIRVGTSMAAEAGWNLVREFFGRSGP